MSDAGEELNEFATELERHALKLPRPDRRRFARNRTGPHPGTPQAQMGGDDGRLRP